MRGAGALAIEKARELIGAIVDANTTRKDFVATEHCSGAIQVTDKPATAISPDARLQPLPRSAPRGTASLNIYVDRSGFVCSSMIWKSSGDPDFDIAALEAVSLSRFAPGLRATNAVDSLLRFQITKRF